MQFLIGLGAGLIIAVLFAVAYVAGLNDRVKPMKEKVVKHDDNELEALRQERARKDFINMMSYSTEQAIKRVGD